MIDVHIVDNPKTPMEWKQTLFDSLPDSINIHHIEQHDRTTGENRQIGFMRGNHKYVSYVDDDDYVFPQTFERCYQFLEDNPMIGVVGTLETDLTVNGPVTLTANQINKQLTKMNKKPQNIVGIMHHVIVFRREVIMPHLDQLTKFQTFPERVLLAKLYNTGAKFHLLPFVGYAWRIHQNGVHKHMKSINNIEPERMQYIKQLLFM